MEEQWKVIPDHPDYEVSNLGNFRRATAGKGTQIGKSRKTYINPKTGYGNVTFGKPGLGEGRTTRTYSAHRLVAETWLPNPDKLCCVDHINKNRADNRVENLRWISYKLNTPRRPVRATALRGEEVINFPSVNSALQYFGTTSATLKKYIIENKPFKGYYLEYLSDKKQ